MKRIIFSFTWIIMNIERRIKLQFIVSDPKHLALSMQDDDKEQKRFLNLELILVHTYADLVVYFGPIVIQLSIKHLAIQQCLHFYTIQKNELYCKDSSVFVLGQRLCDRLYYFYGFRFVWNRCLVSDILVNGPTWPWTAHKWMRKNHAE